MNNNERSTRIITSAVSRLRYINDTQINSLTEEIETELMRMFPFLKGKEEDGVENWACDIINCSSHGEVAATLERIALIERTRENNVKIQLIYKRLSELRGEVTELENEIERLEIENS